MTTPSSSSTSPSSDLIPLIEFAINLQNENDLKRLDKALSSKGVKLVASDLVAKTVQVQFGEQFKSALIDAQSLQKYVEQQTGLLAVIKGIGHLMAAVAELRPPPKMSETSFRHSLFGVVRMSQMTNGSCFVDGLIQSTSPENVEVERQQQQSANTTPTSSNAMGLLAIHEFGDLSSDTFDSVGAPEIDLTRSQIPSGKSISISIQKVVPDCDVVQQIGKSMALSLIPDADARSSVEILTAGVIARASTIQSNTKQVCSCSGKTIWQERKERQEEPNRKI